MLNYIWPILIISSFVYCIIFGNISEMNSSILGSTEETINLCIRLLGVMCLWNGVIKIIEKTSILKRLEKIIKPLIKLLFPRISEDEEEYSLISLNIIANLLGLGNAATPLGIRAIKKLSKKENSNKLSDNMAIFTVLNTTSIQIIPTTIIAIRYSLHSENPTLVLIPIWISSICAVIVAIIVEKILLKII